MLRNSELANYLLKFLAEWPCLVSAIETHSQSWVRG